MFRPPSPSYHGDERFTSQGSQQPLGSPLSREEGEATPRAPAPEGPRRSRRVRLRGSCRHRPSFLNRRELAASSPARHAPTFSEVSESGNNGRGGREGWVRWSCLLKRGPEVKEQVVWVWAGLADGICGAPVGGRGLRFQEALPGERGGRGGARTGKILAWVGGLGGTQHRTFHFESWHVHCQNCDLGWVLQPL